jgi:hypothetical protein
MLRVVPGCDLTVMSYLVFQSLLIDFQNQCYNPELLRHHQDMSRPMSHYFIATSHNTYLTGNQLTGDSSVNQYIAVLSKGCRCVELDIWDGKNNEPIILHGGTLTKPVLFIGNL